MSFSIETVVTIAVTIVCLLGCVLAMYTNLQEIKKQVVSEAVWRVKIESTLNTFTEQVKTLTTELKENSSVVKETQKEQILNNHVLETLKRRIESLEKER